MVEKIPVWKHWLCEGNRKVDSIVIEGSYLRWGEWAIELSKIKDLPKMSYKED